MTPTDAILWGFFIGVACIATALVGWIIDAIDGAAERYAQKKDAPEG